MAGNAAKASFGFKFYRGDQASATNFVEVAEITNLKIPGLSKTMKDVTVHASPGTVTQMRGTRITWKPGRINVNLVLDDATKLHNYATGLAYDAATLGERYYKIVDPETEFNWYGPAEISDFDIEDQVTDGIQAASFEFTPTGQWTAAAI